jgi:hypothetical protein
MKDITINKVVTSKHVIYIHGTYLIDKISFQGKETYCLKNRTFFLNLFFLSLKLPVYLNLTNPSTYHQRLDCYIQ